MAASEAHAELSNGVFARRERLRKLSSRGSWLLYCVKHLSDQNPRAVTAVEGCQCVARRANLWLMAIDCLAVINLMWFAAAIGITLAHAGEDGWGATAVAASAALGALFLLLVAMVTALAYSSGSHVLASGLNDFV